jgi:hypothetical protein
LSQNDPEYNTSVAPVNDPTSTVPSLPMVMRAMSCVPPVE